MKKQTSGFSVAGLVLSIFALFLICLHPMNGVVFGIASLILCFIGKSKTQSTRGVTRVGLIISAIAIIFGLFASVTGSNNSKKTDDTSQTSTSEKEYVTDSVDVVSSDPNHYKGKYITFNGCNINEVQEDSDAVYYQIYTSLDNTNSVIVEVPKSVSSEKITSDYVTVDGKIKGNKHGKTIVGVSKNWAYVIADSITPTDYISTFGKADTTWTYSDKIISQHDIDVQVTQVDFNSTETRVYVTVTNNSSNKFNIYDYSAKVVQNGQQYDVTYNYNADYAKLSSDILSGASTSGIIIFPPLSASDMQLQIEGSSDDWNIDFEPFTFDLTAQQ